jgi:hypothetical protein
MSFADLSRLAPPPAPGAAWEKRWVKSSWKVKDGTAGDWTLTPGKWFGDAKADAGIQTGPDARFFAIAAPFKKPVDTEGKTLVVQVSGRQPGGCGLAQAGWCQIWPLVVARARNKACSPRNAPPHAPDSPALLPGCHPSSSP